MMIPFKEANYSHEVIVQQYSMYIGILVYRMEQTTDKIVGHSKLVYYYQIIFHLHILT